MGMDRWQGGQGNERKRRQWQNVVSENDPYKPHKNLSVGTSPSVFTPPPQPQLWDPPPQPPVFFGGDASLAVACRHYFLPGSVRYKIYAQSPHFFFFFLLKSNYKLLVIKICSEIK